MRWLAAGVFTLSACNAQQPKAADPPSPSPPHYQAVGTTYGIYVLDTVTGNAIWINGYGGANSDYGDAVAVSGAGRIAMGGSFMNSVDFGGGALVAVNEGAFLATFDAVPTHLWSKQFSSSAPSQFNTSSIAFGPIGEVVAGGQFGGTVDFGQGPLTAGGGATAFLVRVAP